MTSCASFATGHGTAARRGYLPRMPDPAGLPALQDAIRHLHGVESRHVESVHVREEHHGELVFERDVEVFDLIGHPLAKRAYAWSEATTGAKRRFFAVLRVPPIDSAIVAVRGSLVSDARELPKRSDKSPKN